MQTCRRELLDRTLIWNQRHLLHALREFDQFSNSHRGIANARPLPYFDDHRTGAASRLDIHRHDRLGLVRLRALRALGISGRALRSTWRA